MSMYYYANKLNEPSCSSNRHSLRTPPEPPDPDPGPPPGPPPAPDHGHMGAEPSHLRTGPGLLYYDNNDYYSMMTPRTIPALPYVNFGERPDIEYRDGLIVNGTLEALIDMLRPGINKTYKFTFLLCSRLYIKPHELLHMLCKKYCRNFDRQNERANPGAESLGPLHQDMAGLVSLFSQWTIMFPHDFRDDRVMALVRVMSERCSAEHMEEIRVEMSTTLQTLLDKLTALEQYEESLHDVPQMSCVEHLAQEDILTLGLTPVALATQLTMVELHRLSFVGPEEFVQTFAPQAASPTRPAAASSIKLHHMDAKCTRNLEAYADWFNRLSYLVASDILKSPKSKYRSRVIEQWVVTARECFNLGNFNSLMAIISGLNMAPIARLKKTWSRTSPVCGQQLRQLELCLEPGGNHARYRQALAAAPFDTAVPLLSVTCRDLHFANQGAPSMLSANRINFEKWVSLARAVDTQLAARRLTGAALPAAPLAPQHVAVWRFLNDRPTLTENALEVTSFEREAPVDNLEKERLKRLKSGAS